MAFYTIYDKNKLTRTLDWGDVGVEGYKFQLDVRGTKEVAELERGGRGWG